MEENSTPRGNRQPAYARSNTRRAISPHGYHAYRPYILSPAPLASVGLEWRVKHNGFSAIFHAHDYL
jgi:hypothetical protein